MSQVGFRVEGSKAYLLCGGHEKEIPRDCVLEIYQLVLGQMSPNRDYSNVTSVSKLLRIINLECEPDESEDESQNEPAASPEPEVKPAAKPSVKAAAKAEPQKQPASSKRPGARTVRKTPAKAAPAASASASASTSESD